MRLVVGEAEVDDVDAFVERLDAIGEEHGCSTAAFDARYVAGGRHLEVAVERANRAFRRDDAIADDRGIEILLYAAGRRQIDRALAMGVGEGGGTVAVVVDAGEASGADEPSAAADVAALLEAGEVIEGGRDPVPALEAAGEEPLVRAFFGITEEEIGATEAPLEDLVIERVSMLAIEK